MTRRRPGCSSRIAITSAILLSMLLSLVSAVDARTLALLTVESGAHARKGTTLSVALPASLDASQPMHLIERSGATAIEVPSQIEPGDPGRLWFTLPGELPAGAKRSYELRSGRMPEKGPLRFDLTASTLDVIHGEQKVFSYNHAHVPPPQGVDPAYIRSGYIHPLFSPGGKLITEDFPGDHHHHKGIWFPWTSTTFDGHHVDFWNLAKKEGTVQFAGFASIENGPIYARFRVKHEFVDLQKPPHGKVALDETWDVRVLADGGARAGYWLWDIASTQRCASESPLHLEKYRYGGMAYRGPKEWNGDNYILLTSEGKTKENGHTTRAKWCAQSGAIDGKWTTVVMMCSPKNERFPEPMRIWASGGAFFNFTPIQHDPWTLEPGKDYTFGYRFLVYEGKIDKERIERAWVDFAAPPAVAIEAGGE